MTAAITTRGLAKRYGQTAIVDNAVGAAGNIGIEKVKRAKGDGHTLLVVPAGNLTINPTLMPNFPFDIAKDFVPVTMLVTAALYGLAACVTFSLLRERTQPQQQAPESSWRQLRRTFSRAREHRDFMWLLACTVCYQGGVAVAITLAAIYAEQVIGFVPSETMVLIFVLNFAAAGGAFAFGYLQDALGHRPALAGSLLVWVAVCVIAAWVTTKGGFWWAAGLAGLAMGASQSAGRAMTGVLAPPAQLAEFFGLWTFATRLASIIGPLSYGAITWATGGNQRIAILSTSVLFVAGLLLLIPLNMARGRQAALQAGDGASSPLGVKAAA